MSDGCWVVYAYDNGPYLVAAFDTELNALRHLNRQAAGYGKVMFLPWGKDLREADLLELWTQEDVVSA